MGPMVEHEALRCLRAAVLAAVVVLTAAAGHVAVGGAAPPAAGLLVLLAVTGLLVAPMLGRRASASRVVALVLTGQALVHLALQWVAPSGHLTHGASALMTSAALAEPGAASRHPAASRELVLAMMSGADLAMLGAHLAAAVAVGLWLAAGERAAWTILALTGRCAVESLGVLCREVASAPAPAGSGTYVVPGWLSALPQGASLWDGYAVSRRGPPCLLPA